MKKFFGYFFIIYGILLIPSGVFGGLFLGAMSTDSGDTSYFYKVMAVITISSWIIAFFLIKIGLRMKKK